MLTKKLYLITLLFYITLTGEAVCAPVKHINVMHGEFDECKALKSVFGNCNPDRLESNWQLPETFFGSEVNMVGSGRYWKENSRSVRSTIIKTFSYTTNEINKKFLVIATSPGDRDYRCHACLPLLGAFVWKKQDDNWILIGANKYIMFSGGFGEIPEDNLTKIIPEIDALVLTNHHVGQGYHTYHSQIVSRVDGDIIKVFAFTTGESNSGACGKDPEGRLIGECWEYEYSLSFVNNKNTMLPDLSLIPHVKGNVPARKGNVNKTRTFTYQNLKYVENTP